jgi:hypothetical protein
VQHDRLLELVFDDLLDAAPLMEAAEHPAEGAEVSELGGLLVAAERLV